MKDTICKDKSYIQNLNPNFIGSQKGSDIYLCGERERAYRREDNGDDVNGIEANC